MKMYENRNDIPIEEKWDLSTIYPSLEDWDNEIYKIKENIELLKTLNHQFSNRLITVQEYLKNIEGCFILMSYWTKYINLAYGVERNNEDLKIRANIKNDLQAKFLIEEIEAKNQLNKYSLETKNPIPSKYKQFFSILSISAPILISEENAEKITELDETVTTSRIDLRKLVDQNEKNTVGLTGTKKYQAFKENENEFTEAMQKIIVAREESATIQGFTSAKEQLFVQDGLLPQMFDNLIQMTYFNKSIFSRYMELSKEYIYGPKMTLVDFKDDNSLMNSVPSSIKDSWELTLKLAEYLGPEYHEITQRAKRERWVDFANNVGKDTGASHVNIFSNHSYIRMIHKGNLNSTFTLNHELGHALNATMNKDFLNERYLSSTTMLEIPAFVAEFLLMKILITEPDVEKLLPQLRVVLNRLHISLVERPLLAEFQHQQHLKILSGKGIHPDCLAHEYYNNYLNYYGSEFIPEVWGYGYLKERHLGTPYYAPKYPIARIISIVIASQLYNKAPNALENYYNFLKVGTRIPYTESLKLFGIDFKDLTSAFNATYDEIDKLIDMFEETVHCVKPQHTNIRGGRL